MGYRWDKSDGKWNMKYECGETELKYDPVLTLLNKKDEVLQVEFTEFGLARKTHRGVPVKWLETVNGKVPVTTVYDLMMAQYGVNRGLSGQYPTDYTDTDAAYTPAWQEIFTGIDSKTVLQFAREWADSANITEGKCMILVGAGINHWYHQNLTYRAGAMALMVCGCVGKNGGGLNHYVGQESWHLLIPGHLLLSQKTGCGFPFTAGAALALY